MSRPRVGKLPRRYSLLLNAHPEVKLSVCTECRRPTHPRKFPLFIHIDGWGPLVLGKTCRYCARCEMVIVHQHELEADLADSPAGYVPNDKHTGYLIIGTVDKKVWQQGLQPPGIPMGVLIEHMADFKKTFDLAYQPGGWFPADEVKGKSYNKSKCANL